MNERLFALIAAARRRWRLRVVLRGAAAFAAALLLAVVAASWVLGRLRFAPLAVTVVPVATWVALAWVAWRALRTAPRRVADAQVALYLEEREPTLQGSLLAAVQHARTNDPALSRGLVRRLVADAVTRGEAAPVWQTLERRGIVQAAASLGVTVAAALALIALRPAFLITGAPFLLPLSAAERPYTIGVAPGDTTIPRGADLSVTARLNGFEAEAADLLVRLGGREDWDRIPMTREDSGRSLGALLLDVRAPLTFLVEAAGVRSPLRTVRVADLPWVDSVSLTYRYPAYTGVAPHQAPGGDVAAVTGTSVTVHVVPTIPVTGGALVVGADTLPMTAGESGRLAGILPVRASGEYRVLMRGEGGLLGPASPAYIIEAVPDLPPAVRLTRPGRDADATAIDEVFLEARAEDDFGVRRLELVYRVNGGPERTVALYAGAPRSEVVAGHTLFLEEMPLRPGDVISYFARARDARPGSAPQLSDIYFLSIRPFDRAFREAEQNGMPGEPGTPDAGELSERQRQIVAAIFRVARDRATMPPTEQRDNFATLALSEGRLREDVATLVGRIRTRGLTAGDSTMAGVAAALDTAVTAMTEAEQQLGRRALDAALPPAQRALALLQRAEAVFNREQQVARGGQPGGGGGGSASSRELADLFDLELDRMRNQYETLEQGRARQADAELDETAERLRELARRQQRENERRAAQPRGTPGASGAAAQRQLAAEADSLARRLERLSREQQTPDLADAAQRMREAAGQMRQATGGGATGSQAVDRLREAQRRLDQGRTAGVRRDADAARARAQRLADQQRDVADDVAGLPEAASADRTERVRRLAERKNQMAGEVRALEGDVDRLSREAQRGQPDAARRLRDAARAVRDGRVEDKIRFSRGTMQGNREYARTLEEQIGADLDSLSSRLAAAAGAIGESREERIARALEPLRDVANALETLPGRAGERGERGERGESGRPGQAGQPGGQPGQSGARTGATGGRQASRELAERLGQLRGIREALRREGVDTRDLDELMGGMGRADNTGPGGEPRGLEELARTLVPGLRDFEFALRRQLMGASTAPHAGAEATVPPAYRDLVAEYYRSLSERRP